MLQRVMLAAMLVLNCCRICLWRPAPATGPPPTGHIVQHGAEQAVALIDSDLLHLTATVAAAALLFCCMTCCH